MANTEELKQQEIEQLTIEVDEVGLEDLIILGEDKKIPLHLTYPNADGTTSKAKMLVKQLTLKEVEKIKTSKKTNGYQLAKQVLKIALFKSTGDQFNEEELNYIPIGIVTAIAEEILTLSGVDLEKQNMISDF